MGSVAVLSRVGLGPGLDPSNAQCKAVQGSARQCKAVQGSARQVQGRCKAGARQCKAVHGRCKAVTGRCKAGARQVQAPFLGGASDTLRYTSSRLRGFTAGAMRLTLCSAAQGAAGSPEGSRAHARGRLGP